MKAFLPLRTVNIAANANEHHFARAKRVRHEKYVTTIMLNTQIGRPPALPVKVTLTRSSPVDRMDSDSCIIAMKAVRDAVATWLLGASAKGTGDDDKDSPSLVWDYSVPKVVGPMGVHVTLTPL